MFHHFHKDKRAMSCICSSNKIVGGKEFLGPVLGGIGGGRMKDDDDDDSEKRTLQVENRDLAHGDFL